ncbi:substrate-binding domain-containing protein [Kitasatospora sp. NBC_00458]|uniref:substrate-binding domain-containing protein n=1 Tax=Kitasatospora sp. NBC_00458 TaxID=2903568 RepID=UPI002E17579F
MTARPARPHRPPGRAARALTRALLALALLTPAALTTSCAPASGGSTTLTVLASSELVDMEPLLTDLKRETGITMALEFRGTVDASTEIGARPGRYDLAWLASDRWLRLDRKDSGTGTPLPPATRTMLSPLAIGLKPAAAERLRHTGADTAASWADIAADAAAGSLRYALADPGATNSGLAALVAVASAVTGTGRVLRPEDVETDLLRGFLVGRTVTAPTTSRLIDAYVQQQDRTDALIAYESDLLVLNAGDRLREPLEIVYPRDGMVLSDYPLLLLDPAKRASYDRVVDWLLKPSTQERIMRQTLRRPVDPTLRRDPRLAHSIGNALYFPDQPQVVRRLLDHYTADTAGSPASAPRPTPDQPAHPVPNPVPNPSSNP